MSEVLHEVDAMAVRRWFAGSLEGLGRARAEIDDLNVFPVPDGDTGTNLYLTIASAVEALEALPPTDELDRTLRTAARGALLGARGNSGIILSQLLLGAGEVLVEAPQVDAEAVAAALHRGAEQAWAAVERPVEGTVLSVARAAASGARTACDQAEQPSLRAVVVAAADAARVALAHTPEQLPVLAAAGVVDSGGRGLCVMLDALVEVVTGALPPTMPSARRRTIVAVDPSTHDGAPGTPPGPCFEVMYLLDAPQERVAALRASLDSLGESLVVVGVDDLWSVHVHVDDAGAAVEAGLAAGRPHRIRITHLDVGSPRAEHPQRAVVAVAVGPGVAELLEQAGVVVVLAPGGVRASAQAMLDAVTSSGATEVLVLPSASASLRVTEAAAARSRAEGIRTAVIPSRSMVATLAAVAVHDSGRDFDSDVVAMTSAASQVLAGSVTLARSTAMTTAGIAREGQALGIVHDDVAVVSDDLLGAACGVVDRLLGSGGELVTLLSGDTGEQLAEQVAAHVRRTRPEVEVSTYAGGQPRYPLLIGVE